MIYRIKPDLVVAVAVNQLFKELQAECTATDSLEFLQEGVLLNVRTLKVVESSLLADFPDIVPHDKKEFDSLDYLVYMRQNLELFKPVDGKGTFKYQPVLTPYRGTKASINRCRVHSLNRLLGKTKYSRQLLHKINMR